MRERIQQKPDLTLRELKAELHTELSVPTLCVALKRPDVAQRRQELQREQPFLNPDRLVCR